MTAKVYGTPDDTYEVYAENASYIQIAISVAGTTVFFPADSFSATKNIDTKLLYGTGFHRARAKNHGHIEFSGSFTIGSFLRQIAKNGEEEARGASLTKFHELLFEQSDEGLPKDFEILMMDDTDSTSESVKVIEKWTGCSVTSDGTEVPDGDTVQKKYDFVAVAREPK